MIPIVEKDIMRKLLGDTLYTDYVANPTDARWIALVDGATYTYDDKSVIWDGTKGIAGNSMMGFFTYERILRDLDSNVVANGVVRQASEKGEYYSVNSRMSLGQNKGVNLYGTYCESRLNGTAYNYLRDNGTYDFDDWVFTPIVKINSLGI